MLAVLGDVDDLAIGMQGLPVYLNAILADLMPCTESGTALAIHNHSAYHHGAQPACASPPLLSALIWLPAVWLLKQ